MPGERISVLRLNRTLVPDPALSDLRVRLPEPYANAEWPQPGGYSTHAMQHLAVSDSLNRVWSASVGQVWKATGFPVEYYALGGQGAGIPLRVTMTAFGPTLLSKVLGLNETQESSLGLVFHYADQAGLPLLDLADLREVVKYLTSDEGKADLKNLGGLSSATAGVILRELISFSDEGADVWPRGRATVRR